MLFSRATTLLASTLATLGAVANAKDIELDWTLRWKVVNPDGLKERQVVSINDQFPLPVLRGSKGDRMIIHVTNELENPARNSSIHFHGLYQNHTNHMDGPPYVTQCNSMPNTTFTYNFTLEQNGTYWYHTHTSELYPDGYRQILLIDDDEPPFEYDEELSFTMSDWYHELNEIITQDDFLTLYNPTGAEPVPQSLLINDTVQPKFLVKPNTTYRMRIANTGAFSAYIFYITGHNFTIVEADGIYTEPAEASSVYISAAQRYSILFTTGPETNTSYQFVQVADQSLYDVIPDDLRLNNTAWFVTDESAECPDITREDIYNNKALWLDPSEDVSLDDFTSDNMGYYDDFELVPVDHMPLLPEPDQEFTVKVSLTNLLDGVNYAFFNSITYTHAKVPTLYSVLSAPDDETANNATIYGVDTHSNVLEHLNVVQLVLNNFDSGSHPFHLHGHHFQVVVRAESIGSDDDSDYYPYDPSTQNVTFPEFPMRRDVLVVKPYSHFVIRWVADNPGVWFFHCHIEWHLTQGLAMLFVEAPTQMRQIYTNIIPQDHYDACQGAQVPIKGNAAANTENFMDLSGQNRQPKDLPGGFTARGIVALVFSCICAFVGMGFLIWYGLSDTPDQLASEAEHFVHDEEVPSEGDIDNQSELNQQHLLNERGQKFTNRLRHPFGGSSNN